MLIVLWARHKCDRLFSKHLIPFQSLFHPFSTLISHNIIIQELLQAPQSPCAQGLGITLCKNVIKYNTDGKKPNLDYYCFDSTTQFV
jgi:hypothetical protein